MCYRNGTSFSVEYRRSWPAGDYSIPMSIYGCPDPDVNTWEYGYINISFKNPIMVETSPYVMGPFGVDVYQTTFCTMVDRADHLQTITGIILYLRRYTKIYS